MEVIYRADDGLEFTREEDCVEYEKKEKEKEKHIIILDENMHRMTTTDNATYVYIIDEERLSLSDDNSINATGFWYWDYDR